jgi:hypothetical protein
MMIILRPIIRKGNDRNITNIIWHSSAILFCLAFLTSSLKATDLSIDSIFSPPSEVEVGSTYPVRFKITNNLYLAADKFTVTVSISNELGIIWSVKDTFGVLAAYTSGTYTSKYTWIPDLVGGKHIVFARVTYSQDIDRSNDTLRKEVAVVPKDTVWAKIIEGIRLSTLQSHNNTKIMESKLHFLPFTPPALGYYNVVLKETSQSPAIWLIKNLIIPAITLPTWMVNWSHEAYTPSPSADTVKVIESTSLTAALTMPMWDELKSFKIPIEYVTDTLSNGKTVDSIPRNLVLNQPNPTVNQPPKDTVYRSDMPNIDLNKLQNPGTVSGYAGDKNACAAASCANSMEWLEIRNPKIKSNISHRDKLTELSKFMERMREEGANDSMIVVGKLRYINAHRLPIHVKFWIKGIAGDIQSGDDIEQKASNQGDGVHGPSWDYLKREMQNNEDVEAGFSFFTKRDTVWRSTGGHAVVISGMGEGGGNKQIWFRDDAVQGRTGGEREVSAQWNLYSDSTPYIKYGRYNGVEYTTVMDGVYSESYDSTVTFKEKGIFDLIFEGAGKYIREQDKAKKGATDFQARVANAVAKRKKGDAAQWIVKNMPYSTDGVNQFETYFDARQMGYVNDSEKNENPDMLATTDSILVKIYYSDSTWLSAKQVSENNFFWYKFNKSSITKLPEGSIDNGNFKITDTYKPYNPTFTGNTVNISDSSLTALEMKIIELDNKSNPSSTAPPYSGDIAASAPSTVANILEWLEAVNSNLKTNLNQRNKLMTLSYLMNRATGKGATRENFIKGTLNLIDTLKVPLKVKFQSFMTNSGDVQSPNSKYNHNAKNETSSKGKPDWQWIKKELKANGTIAVELGWYDNTGRKSGTWCNIAGYLEQNGTRKLLIKDDCNQDSAGGTRKALLSFDTSSSGYPMLAEHSNSTKQCYIESVVSISYDPTVIFTGIGEEISGAVTNFSIYPNPASDEESLTLEFFAPASGNVEIALYDLIGNKIQEINTGYYEKGQYKVFWNNLDNYSSKLQSGVYVVVLKGDKFKAATKLIKY